MLADSERGKLNFLGSKFLILQSMGEPNEIYMTGGNHCHSGKNPGSGNLQHTGERERFLKN